MKLKLNFITILAILLSVSGGSFSQSPDGTKGMVINPLEITETVMFGTIVTRQITISNTGDSELVWNAAVAYTGQPKVSAPASEGIFPRGKDPASIGRAPKAGSVSSGPLTVSDGTTGYAFDINPGNTFFSFDTGDPSNHTVISSIDYTPSGGTFDAVYTEFTYVIDANTNRLKRVEVASGETTDIGPCNPVSGESWTGITVDKFVNEMYGISSNLTQSTLYSISLFSGSVTVIGSTGIPGAIDLTMDSFGQIYSFSIVTDASYRVDRATGASTLLGSIGFDANYAQGMGYEPLSDIIYLAAFNNATGNGELRILDRETGNTTYVGDLGGEIDALAFPGARSGWLSVDQQSGILPAGATDTITAALSNDFPLTDLTRYGTITFSSNPELDTAVVQVTMFTEGSHYGNLAGYVTHGGIGIPNTMVTATRTNGWSRTVTTNAHGRYFMGNLLFLNYYTVSVNATGFNPISVTDIYIWPETTINLDINLTAPVISVTPTELNETLAPYQTDTLWLTIANTGDGPVTITGSAQVNPKKIAPAAASNGDFPRGIAAPSYGRAPFCNTTGSAKPGSLTGSVAYAFDIYPGYNFFSFNTDDPSTQNIISLITIEPFGGTFDATHTSFVWVIDYNDGYLKKVDVATGEVTSVGYAGFITGQTPTGLTCDKATGILYASATDGSTSTIYTVDPATGAATIVGNTTDPLLIDICIDGTGQMYGYDISDDNAYIIDKTTGASYMIGSIGFDANYAQGMGWDPVNDIIYLAAYNNSTGSGELRILDRVTGNTTLIGSLGGEMDGLAFPGGGRSWLSVGEDPVIIPPGSSAEFPVYFNSADLDVGSYRTGNITLSSNPDVGAVNIPVSLEVFPGSTLYIDQQMFVPAGPVMVPVTAYDFTNMGSFQFTINYDQNHLTYTGTSDWYPGITDVLVYHPEAGKITFVWSAANEGVTIPGDVFFNLNFMFDGTSEFAWITWSDDPTPREFTTFNGNIIRPTYFNGYVVCWIGVPETGAPQSILVFPNPASEVVTVKSDFAMSGIEVISYLGQRVYNQTCSGDKEIQIKVSSLPSGIYFVRVYTGQGVGMVKVAVEH